MDIETFYHDIFLKYRKISTDSRKMEHDSIFFSLSGETFNGNAFATAALNNGAAIAVVDDPNYHSNDGKHVLVDNTLSFLQKLANFHRQHFTCPVIGITGTNGKTTTKELISGLLSLEYKTYFTNGNLNNHIGVPLTLLSVNEQDAQFVVVEMGANHIGEIDDLCKIAEPDYGIITSIGKAHLEGFGSVENIVETKTALYRSVSAKHGIVFVNANSEVLMQHKPANNVVLYGNDGNNIHLNCVGTPHKGNLNVSFDWKYESMPKMQVNSNLYGQYNYENMLAAACIASYFEVDVRKINVFLNSYRSHNNRSEIVHQGSNTMVYDAYNANPSSMKAALSHFLDVNNNNKVVILGDMLELGPTTKQEHQNIVNMLINSNLADVYLIGDNFYTTDCTFKKFKNVAEAQAFFDNIVFKDNLILIKGSRGIKLETLKLHCI